MTVHTVEGMIVSGVEMEPVRGRLVVEDGAVEAIERERVASDAIVVPAFVNAHVHLGDSVAKDAGAGLTLRELVAPPDGLKHRLLRAAGAAELEGAMRRTLRFMRRGGTGACADFREGGPEGVRQLRTAADGLDIDALALGRGDPTVLEVADGYGASGAADDTFDAARQAAAAAGKPFGIHAGEVDAGDINPALDLEPDFLVHMVHAEALHLDRVEDAGTPVVVCPRANASTGVGRPPVPALLERTTVALGTDNVMLNSPSMFREMAQTAIQYDLDDATVLRMATANGATVFDRPDGALEPGRPARYLVIDGGGDNLAGTVDPVRAVVRRAGVADVTSVELPPIPGSSRGASVS
ncbi:MAG: amidohydrolase family protein [Halobacteriales archaeon]